jgi:hypothetical protein
VAHLATRFPLQRGDHLRVCIHRQADLAVYQRVHDRMRINVLGKGQRGASMRMLTQPFTTQHLQAANVACDPCTYLVIMTQHVGRYDILGQAANFRFLWYYRMAQKWLHIGVCARRAKKAEEANS